MFISSLLANTAYSYVQEVTSIITGTQLSKAWTGEIFYF